MRALRVVSAALWLEMAWAVHRDGCPCKDDWKNAVLWASAIAAFVGEFGGNVAFQRAMLPMRLVATVVSWSYASQLRSVSCPKCFTSHREAVMSAAVVLGVASCALDCAALLTSR